MQMEPCRFRNAHPVFNGRFKLLDTVDDVLESVLSLPSRPSTAALQASPGSAHRQGPNLV